MLSQSLYEGDETSDKKVENSEEFGTVQEEATTENCCHNHCLCTRHSVASPCCSVSWKTPFDRTLCGLSGCIVFLMLLGVIAPLIVNSLVYSGVRDAVVIDSTDSPSYDVWASNFDTDDAPVVNYDVYLFDLQNEHLALNGSRPVVVERGPYAFLEYYRKFDITWHDDGDSVTYSAQKFYVFNPQRTGAGLFLDDKITMTYPTALGFQYLLQEIPEETDAALDAALEEKIDSKLFEIEETIQDREEAIINNPVMSDERKNESLAELERLKALVETVRVGLDAYVESAHPGDTLLKLLLCGNNPNHVSPFWSTDPLSAYFGWLNDPILVAVQDLLNAANMSDVPWSTSVPGATTNYTSEEDWARRNSPNTQRTGKNNLELTGQYVRYNNMTTQWVCVDSMASQDPDGYIQGEQFPACQHFDHDWTPEEAHSKGYRLAFATDYANRVEGGDGQIFGAPAVSEKIQMYINDIYRTLFLERTSSVTDWYDVTLHRYQLQPKDLMNATSTPEGWQYYQFAPSGLENLTAVGGLPLFVSKPHFLDGDSSLAGSVVGMSPKREAHDTFIDIEPNTGMLARAHKRLQVVYAMDNMNLPEINPSTVLAVAELCNASNSENVSCPELDAMFACLAIPTDWRFHNDRVYMPYAWADEHIVGTSDDADSIKDIYFIQDLGNKVSLWCYVVSGMLTTLVLGMFFGRRFLLRDLEQRQSAKDGVRTESVTAIRENNDIM